MFQERMDRAQELIAKGDHKHGGQELYDAIFAAGDVDELRAARDLAQRELDGAGWRQKSRYKELLRVAEMHLERRQATVSA